MIPTRAYAAFDPKSPLKPYEFSRREVGPHDVHIEIQYCGVCHSDIHTVRDEWGGAVYPIVPGHEIVGRVTRVGDKVTRFKAGDLAGVGCFVDSCRECSSCRSGEEQYCLKKVSFTYNSTEQDGKTVTQGGYSNHIVVNENYVLLIPPNQPLDRVAPLLCAGITTYSPLMHWGVGKGHRLAVVGLGGLGHMAVKIGRALGAEVSVLSSSRKKEASARELGAHHFHAMNEEGAFDRLAGSFDFILDTVSAEHDLGAYLSLLKVDGTMILVGLPEHPTQLHAGSLIPRRKTLAGSMIGGIRQTQEMLDFCAAHGVLADIEKIPMEKINEAYERMIRQDVKFRFVIDMKTL